MIYITRWFYICLNNSCPSKDIKALKGKENVKNAKYIIHAVGPVYSYSNRQQCRDQLYSAYKRSLEVMLKNNCNSIVFPLISSGIFGYPIDEAWRVALKACKSFIAQNSDFDISIFFKTLSTLFSKDSAK